MTLKPIPHESLAKSEQKKHSNRKKNKNFNPKVSNTSSDTTLKTIVSGLVRFVNRGSKYTVEQIDDLIMAMQRSIIRLQKEKHSIMQKRERKKR
ncbi:hypothetical protein COV82_00890 [Candidatus Peregrinibacteria bacterium CG11_big_fil_rev_8_21_14_0_20_46_8]|nr:MAG: hypothetical protein COV82_00890 [Candidatus Peregrinibacteria bacterium CG11_big_fil_rev_8_21_14_0_20_46_8]